MDDRQMYTEEFEVVRELASVCAQMVLECLYICRIDIPLILWTVNVLVRAVTIWTKACNTT